MVADSSTTLSSGGYDAQISSPSSRRPIKVLVIGFGALGTLYSWILSKGGAEIYALARSNATSLRERGIDIRSDKYGNFEGYKPHKVFSSAQENHASGIRFDYVLCTMKIVPEEKRTGDLIKEVLLGSTSSSSTDDSPPPPKEERPVIVFVENGIGIEEEPYETLVKGGIASTIITCCAWLGATLQERGTVVKHGGLEILQMGLYPAPNPAKDDAEELQWRREKLKVFADTYTRGGGGTDMFEGDIQPARWRKLFWNAAWGGVSTLARQPVSVMLEDENLSYTADAVRKIMLEVLYVARACGVGEEALPASKIDEVFNLTYSQAPRNLEPNSTPNLAQDFKPSLLVDLEANRGMELSPIIGNVIKKAREHRVETPRLDLIFATLRPSLMNVVKAQQKKG